MGYLSNDSKHEELMRSLLPARFAGRDFELASFRKRHQQLLEILTTQTSKEAAHKALIMQVIAGPASSNAQNLSHASHIEGFMMELERWSMELQRSNPKDWNQCSSVIVQCLSGGLQKTRDEEFNV